MDLTLGGRVQRPLTCGPSGWSVGQTLCPADPTLQPPMSFLGGVALQDAPSPFLAYLINSSHGQPKEP
jgi:hypothetical protein